MVLPHTLTLEFMEAVDNLIHDTNILDSTLHSRAQQYLEVFNESNPVQHASPTWVERIHKSSPRRTRLTTPRLFDAMYQIADELSVVAGKRYLSAAICACGEHAGIPGEAGGPQALRAEQAAGLARALHQLSSTWVAFVLWPIYAHGWHEDRDTTHAWIEDLPSFMGDDTPTPERVARAQAAVHRRRCEKQVRERDDYRCFMTGVYDTKSMHRRPFPADARFLCCGTVSIIPSSKVWAHEDARSQDMILGMLARFCAVDGTAISEKASVAAPRNTLFVYVSVVDGFKKLLWSLHPTEEPHRYEIKSYGPSCDEGCRHISTHVTFVDHSPSPSLSPSASGVEGPQASGPVDLPDRELLRVHAALAGMLHRSGAGDTFTALVYSYQGFAYPAGSGGAFWKSVVEYEGPEVCLEVEENGRLRESPGSYGESEPERFAS